MGYTKDEGSYARIIKIREIKFVLVTVPERSLDNSLYYKEGPEKVETSEDWKQGTACVLRFSVPPLIYHPNMLPAFKLPTASDLPSFSQSAMLGSTAYCQTIEK